MTETILNEDTQERNWAINIDSFEGPFDLLLHLIKKNNMDIYDIPIAEITAEYLRYIDIMNTLELDTVGDFLIVASVLMQIKSRTLLPKPELEIEDEEEDPEELKRKLIERLIEYSKYRESAKILKDREHRFDGVMPIQQYPVSEFQTQNCPRRMFV